jgi:putative Ca2+/H+ antiporter (TMEM165/GDT1 family)
VEPIYAFVNSAVAVFLAEIGDKTMLSTALFAINTRKYTLVLLTSLLAFLTANSICVVAGEVIRGYFDLKLIQEVAAALLISAGFWIILSGESASSGFNSKFNLLACFTTILLMEMGDKTQLVVFSLALIQSTPYLIISGGILGYLAANTIGILLARATSSRLEWCFIRRVAGVLMIALGILVAFNALLL